MTQSAEQEMSAATDFDNLWDYNNPSETEKKFRSVLRSVKDTGDKDAYLQLLTQIARTLGLQMKFDDAHKLLDEVKDQLGENHTRATIRYFLERGRTYNSSKVKDKATEHFLKAYELSLKSGEENYAVDAAHMLGISEEGADGLKWNEKAIELASSSKDDKVLRWLGSLYNNTAWTYHDLGKYDRALELFEKNVDWHTQNKSVQQLIIAKWCVGRALRSLGRIDEAEKIHLGLLDELEQKKVEQDGYIFEELGECALIKGKNDEAAKYFRSAYKLLSGDIWLREYEAPRLERMKKLSEA